MIRNHDRYETKSHLTTLWKPRAEGNKILTTPIHVTRCRKCKWVAAPEYMSLLQGALCSWMLMAWRPFMWPCSYLQGVVESEKGKRLNKLATGHFRSSGVAVFNFKHKQFPYTHLSARLRPARLIDKLCLLLYFPHKALWVKNMWPPLRNVPYSTHLYNIHWTRRRTGYVIKLSI